MGRTLLWPFFDKVFGWDHETHSAKAWISVAPDRLPARERNAIVTASYGQYSYRERAMVLGNAEGTIKTRIRTGLKQLGGELASFQTTPQR